MRNKILVLALVFVAGGLSYYFIDKNSNQKLNGVKKQYHANGQVKSERYYVNGKHDINYPVTHWYESGKKRLEVWYNKDFNPHGDWKAWHENGQLMLYWKYKNGKIVDGVYYMWHTNGEISHLTTMKDNKQHGLQQSFFMSGVLGSESYKKNGKTVGESLTYYKDGSLHMVTEYDENGKYIKQRRYPQQN